MFQGAALHISPSACYVIVPTGTHESFSGLYTGGTAQELYEAHCAAVCDAARLSEGMFDSMRIVYEAITLTEWLGRIPTTPEVI